MLKMKSNFEEEKQEQNVCLFNGWKPIQKLTTRIDGAKRKKMKMKSRDNVLFVWIENKTGRKQCPECATAYEENVEDEGKDVFDDRKKDEWNFFLFSHGRETKQKLMTGI